jgi:hypothetical protein
MFSIESILSGCWILRIVNPLQPMDSSNTTHIVIDARIVKDRDLCGLLPLIANCGQSLFTDRDLRGHLPMITNRVFIHLSRPFVGGDTRVRHSEQSQLFAFASNLCF